jgi:isopenicillin N synthase-like dioxygenase
VSLVIPAVDLSAPDAPAAIDHACRSVGFFGLVGHGIDPALLERFTDRTLRFFDAPTAWKHSVPRPRAGLQRGYTAVGGEVQALAHGEVTPPDLSEHFAVSRFPDTNVWPHDPAFEAAWLETFAALDRLAREVVRTCALALGLDAGYFDDKVDASPGTMRANHYPAVAEVPADGAVRGGAHTDYGTITLLHTDGVPGLEVRAEDGSWHPVPAFPGGFVVNIGDLLARWTNGRWRSTWHRVVLPPGGPPWPRRLSVAFFQTPNPDTVIDCLPTCRSGEEPEPVVAGEWFERKLSAISVGGPT